MQAEVRHSTNTVVHDTEQSPTYSVAKHESKTSSAAIESPKQNVHIVTSDYQYLSKDLFKTILVTCSIIVIEVLLHMLTIGVY